MSAKLRLVVQHGLNTLRAAEKHGLQPALLIRWAQHLTNTVNPPHRSRNSSAVCEKNPKMHLPVVRLKLNWFVLCEQGERMNSYYDQKEYAGRSVHYWKVVLPSLEKIKKRRSIPEPLEPMFPHFQSQDIKVH